MVIILSWTTFLIYFNSFLTFIVLFLACGVGLLFFSCLHFFSFVKIGMEISGAIFSVCETIGLFFFFFLSISITALFHLRLFIGVYSFLFFLLFMKTLVLVGVARFLFCESQTLYVNEFPTSKKKTNKY